VLFTGLETAPALILAVSGGPDSTALLAVAAHWRASLATGPDLIAVTIDHGFRRESAREARAVKQLAKALGVSHRTLRWRGAKPETGLQEAARAMRYRLLADAARRAGARHILTAHTLDDQAETVLIRMARGSGLTGLAAMARETPLDGLVLVRPFLDISKSRLIATLEAAGLSFADDPSNRDPRFLRARLRRLMPQLAEEGLDARRLAQLAQRLRRAETAIEASVDTAAATVPQSPWDSAGPIALDAEKFRSLPAEIGLRLLGRAVARCGDEGPAELAKLESLYEVLVGAMMTQAPRLRRTLAGALVTLGGGALVIERTPPRRSPASGLTHSGAANSVRSRSPIASKTRVNAPRGER
jgi:tRNA(Ile)-lysidine synthase